MHVAQGCGRWEHEGGDIQIPELANSAFEARRKRKSGSAVCAYVCRTGKRSSING